MDRYAVFPDASRDGARIDVRLRDTHDRRWPAGPSGAGRYRTARMPRHLRTTNIIESPCATVRLRQRVTKGAGSRTKALLMAFTLLAMAEERWRKVNDLELLPLVRAGVRFVDGVQEKPKNPIVEAKENAA